MNATPEDDQPSEESHPIGPGQRLRDARLKASLSIEEVGSRLHLDRRVIESLEADDYAKLAAPTFVRGYLRSYARLLGMPSGPLIDAFDGRGLEPPELIPDIATQSDTRSTDFWVVASTVVIVVLLVILATLWFKNERQPAIEAPTALAPPSGTGDATPAAPPVPGPVQETAPIPPPARADPVAAAPGVRAPPAAGSDTGFDTGSDTGSGGQPAGPGPAPEPEPAAGSEPASALDTTIGSTTGSITGPAIGGTASGAGLPAGTELAPAEPGSPGDAADRSREGSMAAEPNEDTAPGVPAELTIDASASATVDLTVLRDAWIEIYDADERRLFYDLARAGRRARLTGRPPLRVLLGYAEGVQIEYNGQPFDFSPYVSKGVARFELGR